MGRCVWGAQSGSRDQPFPSPSARAEQQPVVTGRLSAGAVAIPLMSRRKVCSQGGVLPDTPAGADRRPWRQWRTKGRTSNAQLGSQRGAPGGRDLHGCSGGNGPGGDPDPNKIKKKKLLRSKSTRLRARRPPHRAAKATWSPRSTTGRSALPADCRRGRSCALPPRFRAT